MNSHRDVDEVIGDPGDRQSHHPSESPDTEDIDLLRTTPKRPDDEESVAPAGEASFLARDAPHVEYADSEPSPTSPPATRPPNSPTVSRLGRAAQPLQPGVANSSAAGAMPPTPRQGIFPEVDTESAPGSPPLLGLDQLGQSMSARIQEVPSPTRGRPQGRNTRAAPSQACHRHATQAESHGEGPGATQMDTQTDTADSQMPPPTAVPRASSGTPEADGLPPVSPTIGQAAMRPSTSTGSLGSTVELLRRRAERVNPQSEMLESIDYERQLGEPPRQNASVQSGEEPPPYDAVRMDASDYEARRRAERSGHHRQPSADQAQAPRRGRASSGAARSRSNGAAPVRPSSNPARTQAVPRLNLTNMHRDSTESDARSLPNVSSMDNSSLIGSDDGLQPSGVPPLAEQDRPLREGMRPPVNTPPRSQTNFPRRQRADPQNLAAADDLRPRNDLEDEEAMRFSRSGFVLGRDAVHPHQRPADHSAASSLPHQQVPHQASQPLQPGVASSSVDGAAMREPRRVNFRSPEAAPARAPSPAAPSPAHPPAAHHPAAHPPAAHPAGEVPAETPAQALRHPSTMPAAHPPAAHPPVGLPAETPAQVPRRTSTMGASRTGADEFFTVGGDQGAHSLLPQRSFGAPSPRDAQPQALEEDLEAVMEDVQAEEGPMGDMPSMEVSGRGRPDTGRLPAAGQVTSAGSMGTAGIPHRVPSSWNDTVGPAAASTAAAATAPRPQPGTGGVSGLLAVGEAVLAEPPPPRPHSDGPAAQAPVHSNAPPAEAPAGTAGPMPAHRASTAGAPEPSADGRSFIPNAGVHGGAAPQHAPATEEGPSALPPGRARSREPMLPPQREPMAEPLPQEQHYPGMYGLRPEAASLGSSGPAPPRQRSREPPYHPFPDAGMDPRWPGVDHYPAHMSRPPVGAFNFQAPPPHPYGPPPGAYGPPLAPGAYPAGWGPSGGFNYQHPPMGAGPPPPQYPAGPQAPQPQYPAPAPQHQAPAPAPPPQGSNPGFAPGAGPADGLGAAPAATRQRPQDDLAWGVMPPPSLPADDLAPGLRHVPQHAVPPAPAHSGGPPAAGPEPAVEPVGPGSVPGQGAGLPAPADHPAPDQPADEPGAADGQAPEQGGGEPAVVEEPGRMPTPGPVESHPGAHGAGEPQPGAHGQHGTADASVGQDGNTAGLAEPPQSAPQGNGEQPDSDQFFDVTGSPMQVPEAPAESDQFSIAPPSPGPTTQPRGEMVAAECQTTPEKQVANPPAKKRRKSQFAGDFAAKRKKLEEMVTKPIDEHAVGYTRSRRPRYPPLDFWRNERPVMERKSGEPCAGVVGVIVAKEEIQEDLPGPGQEESPPISDAAAASSADVQAAPAGERRRGRATTRASTGRSAQAASSQGEATSRARSRTTSAPPKPKSMHRPRSRAAPAQAHTASPEQAHSPIFSPDRREEQPDHGEEAPEELGYRDTREWTKLPLVDGSLHQCLLRQGLQNETVLLFDLKIPPQSFSIEEVIDDSRVLQFHVLDAPDGVDLVLDGETALMQKDDHCMVKNGQRYLLRNNSEEAEVYIKMIFGKALSG